jgi:hypothetical protein
MTTARRRRGQVRHSHHLNNQTRPAGKVLDSLALAVVWVVLFPGEPGSLPFSENVLDKVRAELRVDLGRFRLVRTSRCGNILVLTKVSIIFSKFVKKVSANIRKDSSKPCSSC